MKRLNALEAKSFLVINHISLINAGSTVSSAFLRISSHVARACTLSWCWLPYPILVKRYRIVRNTFLPVSAATSLFKLPTNAILPMQQDIHDVTVHGRVVAIDEVGALEHADQLAHKFTGRPYGCFQKARCR